MLMLVRMFVRTGDLGELPIEIPRDRAGTFEPQIITKHQTRWSGFDDKILSLYARGMTVREIQSHLQEMYGAEVSPTLISSVTDAVLDEVKAWQSRPLEALLADPVNGNLEWARIEALLVALGSRVIEGPGSTVTFEHSGRKANFHRPHPGKEALRYRVKAAREFIEKIGVST